MLVVDSEEEEREWLFFDGSYRETVFCSSLSLQVLDSWKSCIIETLKNFKVIEVSVPIYKETRKNEER